MTLYEKIIAEFPELEGSAEFVNGCIRLQNDGDGDYIVKWEYEKPMPKALQEYCKLPNVS
jgi:hypothetical protein